jgi:predicted nucleic-acid-binding Zn-ribbon protein
MSKQYYKCPKCGSENFLCSDMETDDDYAWRICDCVDCQFQWQEVYQFHHNEDLDACNELDEHGNPV